MMASCRRSVSATCCAAVTEHVRRCCTVARPGALLRANLFVQHNATDKSHMMTDCNGRSACTACGPSSWSCDADQGSMQNRTSSLADCRLISLTESAQEVLFKLASTPSCPAHVLLACAHPSLGAAAAQHAETSGCSITLDLCRKGINGEAQEREAERLMSLAAWLWQKGHLLTGLAIHIPQDASSTGRALFPTNIAVSAVVVALSFVGRRPAGLTRLQRLCLPALGNTPLCVIVRTLRGCRNLRHLNLGYSRPAEASTSSALTTGETFPAALAQLTQLTSLHLHGGLLEYYGTGHYATSLDDPRVCLHHLFSRLPSSLVTFSLAGPCRSSWAEGATVPASSLRHLVCLQQLVLPAALEVTCDDSNHSNGGGGGGGVGGQGGGQGGQGGWVVNHGQPHGQPFGGIMMVGGQDGGLLAWAPAAQDFVPIVPAPVAAPAAAQAADSIAPLAALTALTSVDYPEALQFTPSDRGAAYPLLDLPNLQQLKAEECTRAAWELLAEKTSRTLRGLTCCVSLNEGPHNGPRLGELRHLTALQLMAATPAVGMGEDAGLQAWCDAVSLLKRLEHLHIPAFFLRQLDVAPLTALTRLTLVVTSNPHVVVYTQSKLVQLLQRLAPLGGCALREVEVVGVRDAHWQEACRAALAAAVSGVQLVFS